MWTFESQEKAENLLNVDDTTDELWSSNENSRGLVDNDLLSESTNLEKKIGMSIDAFSINLWRMTWKWDRRHYAESVERFLSSLATLLAKRLKLALMSSH